MLNKQITKCDMISLVFVLPFPCTLSVKVLYIYIYVSIITRLNMLI